MKLLYQLVYALVWSLLALRRTLGQLKTILWSETIALLGTTPRASEIHKVASGMKRWKHLGCILDHTHFSRNGMLSGSAIADLVAVAIAADSSYTSVFLPRDLTESEKDILKGMITRKADTLINRDSKVAPEIKFYESVYNTISNDKTEAETLARIRQLVDYRKTHAPASASVKDTSWGISGAKLSAMTNFELTFVNYASETASMTRMGMNGVAKSADKIPTHRITFVSPSDGKPAITRVTQLLSKSVKSHLIEKEDVDQALIHALLSSPEGELWPSPDLIMNFTDTPITYGYPNWHLRYAEIVNIGQLGRGMPLVWRQFNDALCSFSKTVQRFGK